MKRRGFIKTLIGALGLGSTGLAVSGDIEGEPGQELTDMGNAIDAFANRVANYHTGDAPMVWKPIWGESHVDRQAYKEEQVRMNRMMSNMARKMPVSANPHNPKYNSTSTVA